jgi:uncharacterized membrane protein YedE/YeeE
MAWKLVFLSVFLLLSNTVLGKYFTDDARLGQDPSIPVVSTYGYLLGGFFVGFGTRMGNGCTSGHGICGMARLSKRSIVAVCTFMTSAFATASVVAPNNQAFAAGTAWLRTDTVPILYNRWLGFAISMLIVVPSCCGLFNLWKTSRNSHVVHISNCSLTAGCTSGSSCPKEVSSFQACCDGGKQSIHEHDFDPSGLTVAEEHSLEYGTFEIPPSTDCKVVAITEGNDEGPVVDHTMPEPEKKATQGDIETPINRGDMECCPTNGSIPTQEGISVVTSSKDTTTAADLGNNNNNNTPTRDDSVLKLLPSALASALFAVGLAVSEMVLPSKVLGFLNLFTVSMGTYDPTLLTVMIGGCIVSMISYQFVKAYSLIPSNFTRRDALLLDRPLLANKFSIPCNRTLDGPLIGGAFCFGIGWAIAGLCPGPAMFLAASGAKPVLAFWWPMFLVGSFLAQWIKERRDQ